ncbi:MAG: glycosyltransferase family 4 protein [Acidimicrobiales bacterium]
MTAGLNIALAKPDFGVHGGFERVVDRVVAGLELDGHRVERVGVARPARPVPLRGLEVDLRQWERNAEFCSYAAMVEGFEQLDASRYDLVISTQPPSFAVGHDRHLSVFFHHQRVCYDLADVYVEAGFADPLVHRHMVAAVRAMDRPHLAEVTGFLAGSEVVAGRIRRFQGRDAIGIFHAGVESPGEPAPIPDRPAALCISRQEFPKRTELFVQAAHLLGRSGSTVDAHLVGGGGRLGWVDELDRRLTAAPDPGAFTPAELWCNPGIPTGADGVDPAGARRLTVWGRVDDDRLRSLMAASTCTVAPALDEDYGLTAIESMLAGRPVIVCEDGGGLTELVRHGIDGLVVPPTGEAIAAAVDQLCSDPDTAAEMGEAGRSAALAYNWDRALDEVRDAIATVAA